MTRPLLITDCDEVLLHMVSHFADWLGDDHAIDFDITRRFDDAMFHRETREPVSQTEFWPLLEAFFVTEMPRQTLVPGAAAALAMLAEVADIVVLTNLEHHFNEARAVQLEGHGIAHRVVTNRGPKGGPVAALVAEFAPSVTVFVDDLAQHHASVALEAPAVWRLHMIAEPRLAGRTSPAAAAHARIDDWASAEGWITARFADALPAPLP